MRAAQRWRHFLRYDFAVGGEADDAVEAEGAANDVLGEALDGGGVVSAAMRTLVSTEKPECCQLRICWTVSGVMRPPARRRPNPVPLLNVSIRSTISIQAHIIYGMLPQRRIGHR